jgi:molybdenum cofactor biosynthesis enzyme MoaA
MWEQLQPHLDYVEQIYFAGGEPLIMEEHYLILEELERRGRFDVRLIYNTNFTDVKLKDRSVFDYWKKFKQVKISFSIDDINERFELQRNGASWEEVNQNIDKFNSHKSDIFKTDVFTTVSILNVFYLPELIQWANTQNFSYQISLNFLNQPEELSIRNLPDEIKHEVKKKLDNIPECQTVIRWMYQACTIKPNLSFYIDQLDQERNQNYRKSHYEFAKLPESSLKII